MQAVILAMILFWGGAMPTVQTPKTASQMRPLVQEIDGIRVGQTYSSDADVRRIFGNGYYAEDEGHGGGRYFTDPQRRITLHVEIGVDARIDTVELSEGYDIPHKLPLSEKSFLTERLTQSQVIDKKLHLGMKAELIISKLGRPDKDVRKGGHRTLTYQTDAEQDSRVASA